MIPALALTVARDQHADEIRRLAHQIAQLRARVVIAETALIAAVERANMAQREADAERQRIAEQLRVQARKINRRWAGCYRYLANQLTTGGTSA